MDSKSKSPYHGIFFHLLVMVLPSILLVWLFYEVIMNYQGIFGLEFNWASSKILGCGVGMLFHLVVLIQGGFKKSFMAVVNRLKEFFSFITISPSLAFKLYWEDIKTNGVVFWIYFIIISSNLWVFISSLIDFFNLYPKVIANI